MCIHTGVMLHSHTCKTKTHLSLTTMFGSARRFWGGKASALTVASSEMGESARNSDRPSLVVLWIRVSHVPV
jgi:hypothetical protein